MQKLTKREEQIMQVLWQLDKAFVNDIIEKLPEPKPHYNTVATIIRLLQKKGNLSILKNMAIPISIIPLIARDDYQKQAVGDVLKKYFDNSYQKMVAYFAKEEKISPSELEDILKRIKKD